ncbi:TonB-dependent receptor [Janthinobacterium sp. 17J80-10]|uniref:TonB-dependent receptor family protein n=1 Tax=Janthinobacterium sp. 17J80-10 TaxID=2497863 RepID=UPI0013E89970|nr:TonB-dependent receptor [Janthinobacterium sp. 17J80-10]
MSKHSHSRPARAASINSLPAFGRLQPVAALLPLLFANNLYAQQALAPVVVTATRFQSDAANAPIAAQVITADEIRNSSATTVSEVLSKVGGVHTRINFTGVSDLPLDLRGFGMSGDQNTLVLLNGQRISENEGAAARLSAIPLDSIERIEILRGSGAVLYGGGATGGTINIITRSPVIDGVAGNVKVLAGSHKLRESRGGVQAGNGQWGLSLNAQHYENDNYRANNRAEQQAVSGELRFGGRDEFIAFNFSADDQKTRLPGARTEAQLATDPRGASTPDDYLNSDSQVFSLRGEKRLGDVTLAIDIGRRNKDTRLFNSAAWGTSQMDTDVDVTTVSPRLLWKTRLAGMDNRLTVGLDWSEWTYVNKSVGTGFMSSLDESGSQDNRAIYFRDELTLSTGTRLSIGARRENVTQEHAESIVPRPSSTVEHHLSAHELAVQQELGAGYSAYGRVGRSFRVANIDENRCWFAPCPPLLMPQRSSDRELGLEWSGKGASLRAGLFEMDISDEIHYNSLTFTNMNLSPTRRRGLELEGKLPVGKAVDLSARYTRTQARFRQGVYGGVNVAGNDVPLVPKDRVSLNLGWQAAAATRLTVHVNYVGSQRYDNDQANLFRNMPAYTVTDIKVSHDLGAWRLAAGINNLFDKAYYSYGIVNGTYTSFNAYPEVRRNGYVSAEYRF